LAKLFAGTALRKRIDRSSTLPKLMWGLEASAIGALWWLSARVSPDRASAAGRRLVQVLGPRTENEKTGKIKRNLSLAFPDKTQAELDALAHEIWGNLGAVLAEYPHLETICHTEAEQRLETEIQAGVDVEAYRKRSRGAVFVAAHVCNWEVTGAAIQRQGIDAPALYTPLQNPRLDRLLLGFRKRLRCGLISTDAGMRDIIRHLSGGRSLGLVVDQRVDSGEPVPFFGIEKLTSLSPARFALRFGCDLVPIRAHRLEGARYRVTFHEPVRPDDEAADDQEKALQLMRKVNAVFEGWIRDQPGEWLCTKRRWPKDATPPDRP